MLTYPLMAAVQNICARLGMVSGQGLAGVLRRHYPKPVVFGAVLLLFGANTINVGADLGAIADAVDALTLSRGLCAAIVAGAAASGVRDRRGYAGRIAWPLALCGATLTDWIDGPLARRRGRGPSRLGRVLDLELDSWLTLATALAAARLGTLHPLCLITPSLRYAAMVTPLSYGDVFAVGKTDRARVLGIAQMTLALAAFAPFAGSATAQRARIGALALLPVHIVSLIAAIPSAATGHD